MTVIITVNLIQIGLSKGLSKFQGREWGRTKELVLMLEK